MTILWLVISSAKRSFSAIGGSFSVEASQWKPLDGSRSVTLELIEHQLFARKQKRIRLRLFRLRLFRLRLFSLRRIGIKPFDCNLITGQRTLWITNKTLISQTLIAKRVIGDKFLISQTRKKIKKQRKND